MISIHSFIGMDQFDRDSTIADFKNGTIKLMVRCLQCVVFVHISLLYGLPVGRGLYQKDRGTIFLCTDQASEVNKKFIIWHFLFLAGCFEALELRSLDFRQSH